MSTSSRTASASGDKIKVVDYDTHQTLNYTIPRMTLSVNRSTDVVSGVAPAGTHMALEAADFNTPLFGKDPYDVIVTRDGQRQRRLEPRLWPTASI